MKLQNVAALPTALSEAPGNTGMSVSTKSGSTKGSLALDVPDERRQTCTGEAVQRQRVAVVRRRINREEPETKCEQVGANHHGWSESGKCKKRGGGGGLAGTPLLLGSPYGLR